MYCYFYLIFVCAPNIQTHSPHTVSHEFIIYYFLDNFGTINYVDSVDRVVTMSSSKLTLTIVFYICEL